jgi:hypothetical protein
MLGRQRKITSQKFPIDSQEVHPNFSHAAIGVCLFVSFILSLWVLPQAFLGFTLLSIPILIFDAIFIFFIFPLPGPLFHKILLACIGNTVGLTWEYLLSCLAENTSHYFGGALGFVYFVLDPFLQLLWILFMWAISLSILAAKKFERRISALDS